MRNRLIGQPRGIGSSSGHETTPEWGHNPVLPRWRVRVGARLTDEGRDLWAPTLPELRHNSRIRAFIDHAHEAYKPPRRALLGVSAERFGARGCDPRRGIL